MFVWLRTEGTGIVHIVPCHPTTTESIGRLSTPQASIQSMWHKTYIHTARFVLQLWKSNADLLKSLQSRLEQTGLDPEWICLLRIDTVSMLSFKVPYLFQFFLAYRSNDNEIKHKPEAI